MSTPHQKRCTLCLETKEASKGFFSPDPKGIFGLRANCRQCKRAKDSLEMRRKRTPKQKPIAAIDLPPVFDHLKNVKEFVGLFNSEPEPVKPKPIKGIKGPLKKVDSRPKNDKILWSIVCGTDIHFPEQDPLFWNAFLEFIADKKPSEVVLMGDFLELVSCSQHGTSVDFQSLANDFKSGNTALDEITACSAKSKITYLQGNHETRLERFLTTKAPTLLGSLSVPIGLRLKERGVEWVPEDQQPISRGNLDILHGHQLSGDAKSSSVARHHAAKACEIYGDINKIVLYGHTHKPQKYTSPCLGGTKTAIGLGCGRTKRPGWIHGAEAGWEHEFAMVYVTEAGEAHVYTIRVTNGKFIWDGKQYGGKKQ